MHKPPNVDAQASRMLALLEISMAYRMGRGEGGELGHSFECSDTSSNVGYRKA